MQRERVERRRSEADPLGDAGHEQQRPDRGLVKQVVVDGEDVEPGVLGAARDRSYVAGARFVRRPMPSSRAT